MDKIVYNLDDLNLYLKKVTGIVGMFGVASTCMHEAHKIIANIARNRCDVLIGVYYSNWEYIVEKIFGYSNRQRQPFSDITLNQMNKICDVVLVYKDTYTSLENYDINSLKILLETQLPDNEIIGYKDFNIISGVRSCQFLKYIQHDNIKYNFQVAGNKESWRLPYKKWLEDTYNIEYIIIDPVIDINGKVYSSSTLKNNKVPLLYKWFKTKKDVENHLEIIGLNNIGVSFFLLDKQQNMIFVNFEDKKDTSIWWAESLKLEG